MLENAKLLALERGLGDFFAGSVDLPIVTRYADDELGFWTYQFGGSSHLQSAAEVGGYAVELTKFAPSRQQNFPTTYDLFLTAAYTGGLDVDRSKGEDSLSAIVRFRKRPFIDLYQGFSVVTTYRYGITGPGFSGVHRSAIREILGIRRMLHGPKLLARNTFSPLSTKRNVRPTAVIAVVDENIRDRQTLSEISPALQDIVVELDKDRIRATIAALGWTAIETNQEI